MNKFAIFILAIGIFLRLYLVNLIPPHLSNDEISIAYDAYSIIHSGKDEHGHFLPLSFESYGTYKAPLYAYVLAPLEYAFGNNELVVRLPSIVAGLLTIIVIGFITWEFTQNRKIAIWSSVLLSITPWHIYASRMAWEANLALLFLSLGIWLMMRKRLLFSSIFLVISMYGYHTEWLLVPLLMLVGGIIYFKKNVWKFWFISFILALPLAIDFFMHAGPGARANTEPIWTKEGITSFGLFFELIHNYLHCFNPRNLFFSGLDILVKDNPFTPGLLLWPTIIPIIIGARKMKNKFFWVWLFLSPITAALTLGEFSLTRNLNIVIPLVILAAIGLHKMNKVWWCLTIVALFNFSLVYLFHLPKEKGESYQGYRPVALYLKNIENNADEIYIDYRYGNYRWGIGKEYFGIPHLYFAFFQKWDPSVTQTRVTTDEGIYFGKYIIGQVDWGRDIIRPNRYFVVSVGNPPEEKVKNELEEVATFNDSAGNKAFEVWKGK